jgi:hypothetical protein
VATSSSTKKAAKLAQRSGRTRVRFQGGTLFPIVVAAILVLGFALIVYARQSQPVEARPTTNDHWHASYGFYLCNPETGEMEWKQVVGDLLEDPNYIGVHSHDDSVIHWHPFTSSATGDNAQLGVFFEAYGIEVSDSTLRIPGAALGQEEDVVYDEDDTQCGDDDGVLRTQVWQNFTDTNEGTTYTAGINDIRIDQDAMVFTIAFAPNDTDIPKPPNASQLPELGAEDNLTTGQSLLPGVTTTLPAPVEGTAPAGEPSDTQPTTGSTAPPASTG